MRSTSLRFWAYPNQASRISENEIKAKNAEALVKAKAEIESKLAKYRCPLTLIVPCIPITARPVKLETEGKENKQEYIIRDQRQFTFHTFELGALLQALKSKSQNPMNREPLFPEDIPGIVHFDFECIAAADKILELHGCTRKDLLESEGIRLELYERVLKINFANLPGYKERALWRNPPQQAEQEKKWQPEQIAALASTPFIALLEINYFMKIVEEAGSLEALKNELQRIPRRVANYLFEISRELIVNRDLDAVWRLLPTVRTEGAEVIPAFLAGTAITGITLATTKEVYTQIKERESWSYKSRQQKCFLLFAFFCIVLFALDGSTDCLGLVSLLTPALFSRSLVGFLPAAVVAAGGAKATRDRSVIDDQSVVNEICRLSMSR